MFNPVNKKPPPIRSLIAHESVIDGNFLFADGLRVDGQINGNVRANADKPSILVVSETAAINGEIHADHVVINGAVNGPIHARVLLELQPKAKIKGDVHYKILEMHQGSMIDGQLKPIVLAEEKPVLKLAANSK
jgi:cytoskeletal protein CcmA (bactofilin family)